MEDRFRSVLENGLDAAYRRNLQLDPDHYDYMSPVIQQIIGWSADEMTGFEHGMIMDHIHPDDLPRVGQEIERTTNGHGSN
jgi:PAS domain-containing protein